MSPRGISWGYGEMDSPQIGAGTMDSQTRQRIQRLESERLSWGIAFFNAMSAQRMAQAERRIELIDQKLATLRGE